MAVGLSQVLCTLVLILGSLMVQCTKYIVDNRLTGSTMQRYRNTEIICLANLLLPGRHYIIYRSSCGLSPAHRVITILALEHVNWIWDF